MTSEAEVKELAEIITKAWRSKITNEAVLQMAKDILASGYINKKNIKLTAISDEEAIVSMYPEETKLDKPPYRGLTKQEEYLIQAQLDRNLKEIGK